MSAQWSPSPPAPPPPSRQRSAAAFRTTLIVAGVAIAGSVGLVIWGGGDGPAAAGPGGQVPGDAVVPGELSGGELAASGATPGVAVATAVPGGVAAAPVTAVTGTGAGQAGSYEADIGMQDSLIGLLPVPSGATELPPDGAGVRSWMIPGTDWQAARDAYLPLLGGSGYTFVMTEAVDGGSDVGELYTLTHASGPTLQLAVGLYDGQSIIEVTRR